MSVTELDTFIQKFYQLWNAGQTAHLDVDTHAGKAWVGLRVQLGQAPGPLHQHPHTKKTVSPSSHRRRARRAAARLTAEEAVNEEPSEETATEEEATVINVETDNASVEETLPKEPHTSEQHQTTEEVEDVEDANVVAEATICETAVEVKTCDLCDNTFGTLKGLRAHIGSQHKEIPQVDGSSDVVNEPTYCRVCKECPDDVETSEDINFYVMNDHEVMAVIENYGQEWASERQYCIRRWSPFEKFFKTP